MFTDLSAFPLTPLHDDRLAETAYAGLIRRLAAAGVDSITALGSTGSSPYLSADERKRAARIAVENAGGVPVIVGVGALRTSHVLELARDAEAIGAAGLLLAPLSYQRLTHDDVLGLYTDVAAATALPIIVYDNPTATHFTFTDELYARLAELPNVASIKIPGVPEGQEAADARIAELRSILPARVTIGVSGDAHAARGLNAGCDAWYSVTGGTLPGPALALTRAARSGDAAGADAESARLQPLWELYREFGGGYRVIAAIAELLGLVPNRCLPRPILGLDDAARARVARVVEGLGLEA